MTISIGRFPILHAQPLIVEMMVDTDGKSVSRLGVAVKKIAEKAERKTEWQAIPRLDAPSPERQEEEKNERK